MADQVISLSSSDDEDSVEPPPKKLRITPNLPECTLTLVSSPKTTEDAAKKIETVSLDSDDEVSDDKNDLLKENPKKSDGILEKTNNDRNVIDNVDLISLTDDEDIQPKINKTNNNITENSTTKKKSSQLDEEAAIPIYDSDPEAETCKEIEITTDQNKTNIENIDKDKNTNSIIIDDSDDETEKENHCENESNETFPVEIGKTSATDISAASTSKLNKKRCLDEHKNNSSECFIKTANHKEASSAAVNGNQEQGETAEAKILFKKFIRVVEEKIVDSTFEEILPKKAPIIKKYFNRCGTFVNDKPFMTLLTERIETMRKSSTANAANSAVIAFHKVFDFLKTHIVETTIVVEEDHIPKIKKLERTIKLLRKRIRRLEAAEVNWDDDEDSAYIMLDRYQSRLNKVYAKYCQYIQRNPYSGRPTYDRITFVNSSYNEINQALTKKYKNSLVFPSYFELENFITKIAKKEKLNLSEAEIKIESKKCFKILGNILQKKRRQELYESHSDFVESTEDPATKDLSLENVLKKNYAEGTEKIEKLYQKYVNKQERGEDHISSNEEPSSEESDAEDDNVKEGKVRKINNVKIKSKSNKTETENNENDDKDYEEENVKNASEKVDEQDNKDKEEISSDKQQESQQDEDLQNDDGNDKKDMDVEKDKKENSSSDLNGQIEN